jgi:multidrug efflux pump subunit AcrA (membrane-fusion protein)
MKHLFVVSVGLVAAVGSYACSTHEPKAGSSGTPVAVSSALVVETELYAPFEAGGVVRAQRVATVVSRIMAEVRAVSVKPGDRVRAGQALVLLDARELQAHRTRAVASQAVVQQSTALADADRQAAEAALMLARVTHERIADLRAKNSATQNELDEAVAALRGAEARLKVAEARVAESKAAVDSAVAGTSVAQVTASYATLTAPFDGVVTEKMVDPGNMATPGVPLVTVEDDRSFRLEVRLDESRASLVHVGDTVDVRLDERASGGPTEQTTASPAVVAGRVAELQRMLDPGAHDFLVKIDLPAGQSLRSGMYGRAVFRGEPHRGLAIPEAAVSRRGQLVVVFVVGADNRAHLRLVNASEATDGRIEIRAGLVAGERVVVAPPPALVDGSSVSAAPGAGAGSVR